MSDITLWQGDCLELMKNIPNNSVDCILCDLPYGVTVNKKDITLSFDTLWNEYKRIIKINGVICLFAQGLFYVDLVNSNRSWFKYDIVWDKQLISGFLNAKKCPLRKHEQIAVFYQKPPTYNPQYSISDKPNHSRGKREGDDFNGLNYNGYKITPTVVTNKKYPTSIVSFQKPHPSKCVHPTQKPVELLEYLIKTYTNEGDTVLDNCMGSGSTGVACIHTNRNFIGIELDENYFKIAEERIDNEKDNS